MGVDDRLSCSARGMQTGAVAATKGGASSSYQRAIGAKDEISESTGFLPLVITGLDRSSPAMTSERRRDNFNDALR
jgi:hypothetical protein